MAGIRLKSLLSSAPCGSRHPAAEPLRAERANIRSATGPGTGEGRRTRANPTGLNLFVPLRYSKTDERRTRSSYLPCFHPLESQKGPIFWEKYVSSLGAVADSAVQAAIPRAGRSTAEEGKRRPERAGIRTKP